MRDETLPQPADRVNRQFAATGAEPVMGGGPHVRGHPVGLCLCGVCRGCVCPAHRGLAGQPLPAHRPGAGRIGTGPVVTATVPTGLIHHSDRGSQYLSIRLYRTPGGSAGIESSVGSVGDSYDNALAETIIGLYKTEVIRTRGPWKTIDEVEYATLEWVDWFNNRRLLAPLGHVPPAEYEQMYYDRHNRSCEAA